ncbi:MAG: nucleotide sugar dehydrogenase [Candidatus Peribacteraceae bacterium]|nr:nucleotide sugar dehydrogenase [Candidatus Peribacteraceae bacterium]MDD5075363.1 nucleotide sugar dehydrogenase [Candidatus Peribacteraceae bacterium]
MKRPTICIVGLGYVGLPLAHAFAKKGYDVIGYDINALRVGELKEGRDHTRELTPRQLAEVAIRFTVDPAMIREAEIVILAIPTPVDEKNNPDLRPVEGASHTVGKHLRKGAIIVYESTVYPGTTEEICGPILEQESGLKCGTDFTLGYSPERVNPGDKEHTIVKIKKIVSGQDEKTLNTLADLYGSVIEAGIHRAPNIKVAEMAKAIENAQRDLNIAFVNEISLLCHRIGISSKDVLDAAKTKWNFLPFLPGLVGGHCIGVDPYYLVEKARQLGMETQVITAGRALNDSMSRHVAEETVAALKGMAHPRVLVLGLTFKENIPDTRNSKSKDVVKHLEKLGCIVEVHDPYATPEYVAQNKMNTGSLTGEPYDALVLLVPHREYIADPQTLLKAVKKGGVLYDLKTILPPDVLRKSGLTCLAL